MAELATVARPYAEALFDANGGADLLPQMDALSLVSRNEQLLQFADNPKVPAEQVFSIIVDVVKVPLAPAVQNLLRAVIDNGRLVAMPEIALQFRALINDRAGVSDAKIYSAYPVEPSQLAEVVGALEKRFGRKLNATVEVNPELIGGIRAVVGDEVLDTSVKARLEQMKVALTA